MEPSTRKAILCVDDEGIILMYLTMILEGKYGNRFLYEKASNADAALAIIERLFEAKIKLIVILSDWLLPGIRGDEFLRTVHSQHPEIRAIMISGRTDEESVRDLAAETGLFGFLSKPIVPEQLYTLIDKLES